MAALLYKWLFLVFMTATGYTGQEKSGSPVHPFFVSVTEINHNAGDKNLEISCKIFTDDFEAALAEYVAGLLGSQSLQNRRTAEPQSRRTAEPEDGAFQDGEPRTKNPEPLNRGTAEPLVRTKEQRNKRTKAH